jgi:peptidoglycan/xylan/chitin deacetylase (PgdA/CDA1 family)
MADDFKTNPITHVSSDRVLLSFDDGPRPNIAPLILDILRDFGTHACFFVCGQSGVQHPQLLRRIVVEGHEIGNHTWSHLRLMEATESDIFREIQMTQKLIEETTGRSARFFRPPHGKIDPMTVKMVQDEFSMTTMLWSLDPEDWSSPGVAAIHSRVSSMVQGGDIVLLHERGQTVEALPAILSSLRDLNLRAIV